MFYYLVRPFFYYFVYNKNLIYSTIFAFFDNRFERLGIQLEKKVPFYTYINIWLSRSGTLLLQPKEYEIFKFRIIQFSQIVNFLNHRIR